MNIVPTKIKRRYYGFTLIETVVTMVLLGLIITLATSITLIIDNSRKLTQLDSLDESELVKLRSAIDEWILMHDSELKTLNVGVHEITTESSDETSSYMKFENDRLVLNGPSKDRTVIKFKSIHDVVFTVCEGNLICCTAHFHTADYKILSYLRAAKLSYTEQQ